jgi:dihydroneopterin aldolase
VGHNLEYCPSNLTAFHNIFCLDSKGSLSYQRRLKLVYDKQFQIHITQPTVNSLMEVRTLGPCTAKHYAWALQSHGGDPHTVIRVQNLSTQALVGGAVWGIQEGVRRNQLQPILLSARLSLRRPFMSAAESDVVNDTTINYSTLSKEILKIVGSRRPDIPHSDDFMGLQMNWSLCDLLEWIEIYLTGNLRPGRKPPFNRLNSYIEGGVPGLEEKGSKLYKPPLLDIKNLLEVGFKIFLPKATLLSEGVSLTTSTSYANRKAVQQSSLSFSVLKIHNIRIPTLIGVNSKERLAKQMVIVNVEIDPYVCKENDRYNELEQIIVKVGGSRELSSN